MAARSCVRLTSAADVFERVGDVFAADPIMTNLVGSSLLHGDECDVVVAIDDDEPLGVAMRWGSDMTVTPLGAGGPDTLADGLADTSFETITAPVPDAFELAGAWATRAGGAYRPVEVMRVMRLDEPPPLPGAGTIGRPSADELDVQVDWAMRFADDVGHPAEREAFRAATQRQIDQGRIFTWLVGGETVSHLVVSHVAFGVVRIGGVYTPDDRRGHGFASALTAAVAAAQLARPEVTTVSLQAQSHEAHTNRMYRRIGFEYAGDLAVVSVTGPVRGAAV